MLSEITVEQVRERYPELGEIGVKLTRDYINLKVKAVEVGLLGKNELYEIESRYEEGITIERLQNLSADILSLMKTLVSEIKVPEDSVDFEEWKSHSLEYPRVVCYDAFIDIFISINKELSKGQE